MLTKTESKPTKEEVNTDLKAKNKRLMSFIITTVWEVDKVLYHLTL